MNAADLVTWEVTYTDGTLDRESDGKIYAGIDRNKLKSFRLVSPDGQNLFETFVPDGRNGNHLTYRRRVSFCNGSRSSIFVIGWWGGPAFAIDIDNGTYRVSEEGFKDGDPDLYPPVAMAGEKWLLDV